MQRAGPVGPALHPIFRLLNLELLAYFEVDESAVRIVDRQVTVTVRAGDKRRLFIEHVVATDSERQPVE